MKFRSKMRKLTKATGMLLMLGLGAATTAYAAGPGEASQGTTQQAVTQSSRWEGTGDTWRIKSQDGSTYLTNSWFQDNDSSWYMLGSDSLMFSGLITDASTGKSYLLNANHDGTYGKMLTADGVYNVNGAQVYLTFDQSHNGTFGAITSGLSEARSTGVKETTLASVPTGGTGAAEASTEATAGDGELIGVGSGEVTGHYLTDEEVKAKLDRMTDEEIEAILESDGSTVAHPDDLNTEAAHELSKIMKH